MPRVLFPAALLLYICLDRALDGLGAALYFGRGWEMMFVWLVAILFLAMGGSLLWQDRTQRALLLSPYVLPTGRGLAWHLFGLCFFTACLLVGLTTLERWWNTEWIDLWFKLVRTLMQAGFWFIAGRWWRDAVGPFFMRYRTDAFSEKGNR